MSSGRVVRSHPSGSLLTIWVVPGARRTEVVGFHGDALRIRVAAPPEKGKANKAVLAHLESELDCRMRLASGAGSRRKRLIAVDIAPSDLVDRISRIVN